MAKNQGLGCVWGGVGPTFCEKAQWEEMKLGAEDLPETGKG